MKKMEDFKIWVNTIASTIFSFFGLLAIPIILLVVCNTFDFITGCAASRFKNEKIESAYFFNGIVKKLSMYILVFVGWAMDVLLAYAVTSLNIPIVLPNIIACVVAVWLVVNELISITENIEVLGIDVPFLRPIMNLIKEKVEETVEEKED